MNLQTPNISLIPKEILEVAQTLNTAGFESYLVGGCVRDIYLNRKPKDWDLTTNAKPEQIIGLFNKTFYENTFGTVGVVLSEDENFDPTLKVVEVTPYRTEGEYSDGRRPDSVTFSTKIEDDLKRRDFTVNAIAYDPIKDKVVDLFNGVSDINEKVIKAVGDASKRFQEDGLRLLRAVRFSAELGFMINNDTEKALNGSREMLEKIAKERIRDEFNKILMSDNPMVAIVMCQKLGLLKYIVPELEEGLHTKQNQAHSFGVFEHLVRSLQCAADKKYPFEVRIAALFHDIGKPKSRRFSEEKKDYTFYGHEVIGAQMTKVIMERLCYPRKTIDLVVTYVRWHMFFSDTEQISLSAVRRMIANVGQENIWNLMNLRVCDRVGTGRPKENPYRLRKYTAMIEEVLRDPVSVGMLKIDGKHLMEMLHMEPGPKIGLILNALLEEVIEDPSKNTVMFLEKHSRELAALEIDTLKEKADRGKKARDNREKEEIFKIKEKYNIK
jgi:poly(A) polymerase/tRNA nucleotidyltransferase (CCA-adding enzyme)